MRKIFLSIQVGYQLYLLADAKLTSILNRESGYSMIIGLIWKGHEFLDLMKKDTIWEKAKESMKNTGGMAFEILLKVLLEYGTKAVLG